MRITYRTGLNLGYRIYEPEHLGPNTIFAANYALAYRAPALEELYNNGPHIGTVRFEIGNPSLTRELGNGIDLSLRHQTERFRAEVSYFYTHIQDFIFGAPTGEIEDNLPVFEFTQGNSRFSGFEIGLGVELTHWLWLDLGTDYVNAELTDSGEHLPRIPPLRGRAGLEFRHKGFSFAPQLVMASDQDEVFGPETRTAGYAVVNLKAAYYLERRTDRPHHQRRAAQCRRPPVPEPSLVHQGPGARVWPQFQGHVHGQYILRCPSKIQ